MRDLGLLGTIWSLVIIYSGVQLPFSIFLLTTFLRSGVPIEYEEAAHIDGCGNVRVFWHVVVPLLRPVLGTVRHPQRRRHLERLLHAADLPGGQRTDDDPHRHLPIRRSVRDELAAHLRVADHLDDPDPRRSTSIFQRYVIQGFAGGLKG